MKVIESVSEIKEAIVAMGPKAGIGFVPTMGALHQGHLSLVERSVKENRYTIVSIFVNPTQFNDPKDLERYPRDLGKDLKLLEGYGVDIVFAPDSREIYPEKDSRIFDMGGLDKYGEGRFRPRHFNGVAQVVTRLFDITTPNRAYFGEKDFQQLAIIKYITTDLNLPVGIIGVPIYRDEDGLALSSRNMLLSPEHREVAPHIFRTISKAKELMERHTPLTVAEIVKNEINSCELLETEYVEIINALNLQPISEWDQAEEIRLCCAVYAGPIRLIDNIKLR